MEQFLLSPDVAVQRTPQTQSINNAAPENDGESFNPILEEAVAGQQSLSDSQQEPGDQVQSALSEGISENGTPHLPAAFIENILSEQPIENILSEQPIKNILSEQPIENILSEQPIENILSEQPIENILSEQPIAAEIVIPLILNQGQQPTAPTQTTHTLTTPAQTTLTQATLPAAALTPTTETVTPEIFTQAKVHTPSLVTEPTTPTGSASKAETILLQQIQQIIDEGKNIGSISIKSSNASTAGNKEQIDNLQQLSSPILNETKADTIQVRQSTIAQLLPGEQKTFTVNNSKPESGRQEVTEQFLNAKIGEAQTDSQGQTTSQQSDQKGSDGQNKGGIFNATASATPVVTDTAPSETSFSHQLRSSELGTNPTTVSVEGKFAPGATHVVPEKELVDNLVQRFNVNPRLQTSKLTLQLHPAELGQIKIDILVKGNSISANIVAQSQQVLETLDKNMNRLRGVLEDQGFNIDAFEITLDTDSDKQQNLFQEHFASQQQFAADSKKASVQTEDSFDALLDSEEPNTEDKESGLNVTA